MANAEDELRRRRERGRQAQAAYRKRQTRAVGSLAEQNHDFRQGIGRLVNAARGDESREVADAISELARAAGIAYQPRLVAQVDRDDVQGRCSADLVIDAKTQSFSSKGQESLRYGPDAPTKAANRLDCDIWFDPMQCVKVSLPPDDILPYLGLAAETFAGRVFWAIMERAQTRIPSQPAALARQALGHSDATRRIKASFIRSMVDARLEYKRTGGISPRHAAAAEADLGMVVHRRVVDEYRVRGRRPEAWLSCVGVEEHARWMMAGDAFGLLAAPAEGEAARAWGTLFADLTGRLLDASVCFGDGPRWRIEVVHEILGDWIDRVTALPAQVRPSLPRDVQ
ncbi:hypothetical protein S40288_08968 [Stachybotrys chartarum IBT 40288]|nr:hypothetical protein S40288_08968 [Stachybotrys chartarum IBT 40288]